MTLALKLTAALLAALLSPLAAVAQNTRAPSDPTLELNLAVGENQTLPAADVKSYSEGAPGVAEIKLTPNGSQFVIAGQRPGSTTLLLLKRDGSELTYNINVRTTSTSSRVRCARWRRS
jgi:pilus assembly protein CpaC